MLRYVRLGVCFCALLSASSAPLAQTSTSLDAKVQAPDITAPQRGSVVGQLSKTVFGPGDMTRGTYTLPSPLQVPQDRGALLAQIFPTYSPENGMSEWGLGWGTALTVQRSKVAGHVDYTASDELTGPWGRMVKGADGHWYPVGLSQLVRLVWSGGDTMVAHLPDGTQMTFGGVARVTNAQGTYAWALTDVVTVTGRRTALTWMKNTSGRLFLSSASYGGVGTAYQYRVDLAHESLPVPFTDYRSRYALTLDRRVKTVTVRARHAATGAFEERWRYDLGYTDEGLGPASYLSLVQQVYRGGETPPPTSYTYNLAKDRLGATTLEPSTRLATLFSAFGSDVIQPSRSVPLDLDQDGRIDLEHNTEFKLLRQTETGFAVEPLPLAPPGVFARCRKPANDLNAPRTLVEMLGNGAVHVVDLMGDGYKTSTLFTVCERDGKKVGGGTWLSGDWVPGPTIRLVDVNGDHKPDLVKLLAGEYRVLLNTSTTASNGATTYSFGPQKRVLIGPVITPDTMWVHDVNGDGIADLVARTATSIVVWYGKGNGDWETIGKAYAIYTAQAQITGLRDYAFTFADANRDGLTDLILSRAVGNATSLYVNRGPYFQEVQTPGLRLVSSTMSKPVVAGLGGTGNLEVWFGASGQAYVVELERPGTGLMASADDGKGTVLGFEYDRSKPSPGGRQRQAVLSRLAVQSTGYGDNAFEYGYEHPVLHTAGQFLVGYGRVERRDGQVAELGQPLSTSWTEFLNGDTFAALPWRTGLTDAYVPGLEKYTEKTYTDETFQGLPWKRLFYEEAGWTSTDPAQPAFAMSEKTTFVSYERDEYCPHVITKETDAGLLQQVKRYASLPAFARSLACIEEDVAVSGTHADSAYDFSYATFVAHNSAGQVTQVTSLADSDLWVLQDASYDGLWRLETVSSPGKGTTTVSYDPVTGLLASVTAPTGVVVTALERDPVTDALERLRTDRGALVHDQWFRYDGQERLARAWDSIGSGNEFNPDLTLFYRYATATTPASITATTLVSAPSSVRTAMDLLTAKGEAIGAAALIPEGWAMGRITYRDPSAGEATSFKQNTFAPSVDPGLLTIPALFDGADWVTFGQAGELGAGNATTRIHADVQRHVAETLGIDQQRLVRATTENGTFVQTHAADAAGNLTAYWNEAGTAWGYVYDALGRLREVQLPDGKAHRVSFDGHGRVSRVEREGIAVIDYGYEPVTGLLAEKRFTGNTGVLRREITTSHDAIGRVSVETHRDVGTGETRSFTFAYDGGSQLGQLTGVTGQDFEKELAYRADAKLESRVLTLAGGWRTLRTSFTYNEAGEAASQSTTVEDAAGAVLVASSTSDSFDPYGRLFSTELPGSTLATFGYDPDGLLENALLAGGNSLGLTYDGLTRALTGTSQLSGTTVAAVTRRYNARALVDRDSISVGALTVDRSYDYFDERFLKSSTDARAESRYAYSPSGVATSITENEVPVQVTTQSDDLGRTTLRNDLVMTYGPDGQLAWATRGSAVWTFSYDEAGQRLLKYTNGVPVAAYPEEGYLDASGLVQPVKIAGRTVGFLVNGAFEPRSTDLLGSPIADLNGAPRIASPYGSRWLDGHPTRAAALDYVEKGFDADLGLVRMGVRDYDPERALFVSPDPLYLESPNLCVESALDCMLYAYARSNPLLYLDPDGQEPSLSPTNYALYVPEGYGIRFYNYTSREMANPNNPAWQRGVAGLGAFASAPVGLAEEVLRGIFNVPFVVHNAGISIGEHSARAVQRVQSGNYHGAVLEGCHATASASLGVLVAGAVAVPVAGAVEGAVARAAAARAAVGSSPAAFSRILGFTRASLQKGFTKHGADFGLSGNWNPSRAAEFSRAVNQHINSSGVRAISGTYRGHPVTHYVNPQSGLNVMADPAGNYVSGWKLSTQQLSEVLTKGRLF